MSIQAHCMETASTKLISIRTLSMQMYHSIGVFAISDNYSTSASAIDCSFKDSFTAPSHSFWTYISPSCGYSDSELYLLDDRFAALDQRVPGLKRCMETSGSMPIPCSLNGDVHFTEYSSCAFIVPLYLSAEEDCRILDWAWKWCGWERQRWMEWITSCSKQWRKHSCIASHIHDSIHSLFILPFCVVNIVSVDNQVVRLLRPTTYF